ncbi:hypothetical protein [Nocardia wallacei]|uniref:hypothetical protein n=1 Tax=Nocardia wallacei TaxID=480035 RepID=UPI002455F1BD|nr:hypothetical protein [Nocardia wallacei]
MIGIVHAQHRRPTTAPMGRKALVACGVAATVPTLLWMALRPGPVERADAVAPPPASVAPTGPAPAPTGSGPPPADDDTAFMAKMLKESCPTTLGGAKPHVAQAGHLLSRAFGVADVGGTPDSRSDGDHGAGLALDFMVSDSAQGDAIAEFVLANSDRLGVSYVIWQQRYNDGSGWSTMEDRGSPTANHYDHVHVSFSSFAAANLTC